MKISGIRSLGFALLLLIHILFLNSTKFTFAQSASESWKNFYGIAWRGEVNEHITYAKQMGYEYIALMYGEWNRSRYANNTNRDGIKFYLLDPEVLQDMIPIIGQLYIDTAQSYTQEQRDFFEKYMVWKSMEPFPKNVETGWHYTATSFRPEWDFQQQAVIDYVVGQFIALQRVMRIKT
ncbi:MAG: hypothetical protein ACK41Q_02795 [Candidatus Brocadia sp.]